MTKTNEPKESTEFYRNFKLLSEASEGIFEGSDISYEPHQERHDLPNGPGLRGSVREVEEAYYLGIYSLDFRPRERVRFRN